jgi:UDP-N-acetylglucosamine:LPS N-acetylglucosamine transferase
LRKAGAGLTVNSAEELVKQLEVLLKDQDKLQKMSEAAHSLLLHHTADKTVEAILQLLRNNKCQKIAVEAIG